MTIAEQMKIITKALGPYAEQLQLPLVIIVANGDRAEFASPNLDLEQTTELLRVVVEQCEAGSTYNPTKLRSH